MQAPCQARVKLHVIQREILVEIRCRLCALSVFTERPQVVICLSSGMKLSLRLRLAVMTLTIVMLAAIIVGAATVTWRQVERTAWAFQQRSDREFSHCGTPPGCGRSAS